MMPPHDVGSLWRRWDLHIHTPETALNDQFSDWEAYFAALEAQKEVIAIGITDYLTISNYKRVRRAQADGRLPNIKLVIPNIEFRITPFTEAGKAINLHLLVSPDDLAHEERIEDALGRLSFTFRKTPYACLPDRLQALGRAYKEGKTLEDSAALVEGVQQFKIDISAFRDWYQKEHWLSRNSLIAVAGGLRDGVSGLQHDDGYAATREEIYSFAQLIFSGRPKDRQFWIGESEHGLDALKKMGGAKPCIHGSDAHSLDRLLRPDGKRYCWIKADPTFEGLRQIIFEPAERVWIGEVAPDEHDHSRVISSILVSGAGEWFLAEKIPLNPGLVSVIGRKGMGKSALNELIAFAAGAWREGDPQSFLHRARPHLKGMQIRLTWGDGREDTVELPPRGIASEANSVRYLSQSFVEHLCAEEHATGELVQEIESVIFAHLDPSETLNASNFEELRDKRTTTVRQEQRRLIGEIQRLHREVHELYQRKLSVPDRRARHDALAKERANIVEQLPVAVSDEEAKIIGELQSARDSLTQTVAVQAGQRETLLRIDGVRAKVRAFRTDMDRFWSEIKDELKVIGIPDIQWAAFQPTFTGDVDEPLNRRHGEIAHAVSKLEGAETEPAAGTIRAIELRVKELTERSSADEAKKRRLNELQTRIAVIDTEMRRIQQEIERILGAEAERLSNLREDRRRAYAYYFDTLREEQKVLEELYRPLQRRIGEAEDEERHLQFEIRWRVDIDADRPPRSGPLGMLV